MIPGIQTWVYRGESLRYPRIPPFISYNCGVKTKSLSWTQVLRSPLPCGRDGVVVVVSSGFSSARCHKQAGRRWRVALALQRLKAAVPKHVFWKCTTFFCNGFQTNAEKKRRNWTLKLWPSFLPPGPCVSKHVWGNFRHFCLDFEIISRKTDDIWIESVQVLGPS